MTELTVVQTEAVRILLREAQQVLDYVQCNWDALEPEYRGDNQ